MKLQRTPRLKIKPTQDQERALHNTSPQYKYAKTLYLHINNKIYSGGDLSPIEVQPLLEGSELVKKTETFEASVVMST